MRKFAWFQLDVFTSRPLEGNQLAVFTNGSGLTDQQMQAIAREMNFSETTFILPRDPVIERERGVQVRIFTTDEELPFAGHPTLGTASVIRGDSGAPEVALELKVGRIPVSFRDEGALAFGEMRQNDPEFGQVHDRQAIARMAGLSPDEFDSNLPIQTVTTGNPFIIAPLRRLAAMKDLTLDMRLAQAYLVTSDAKFIYFVCRETVDPAARLHARMIFYNGEDPATGSAAGPAAAWMVMHGVAQPDEQVLIEQGLEMKRPSRIYVQAGSQDGRIVNVRVGGHTVKVSQGELFF